MSVKLYCGFEFDNNTITSTGSSANEIIPLAWSSYLKPPYLFHNNGVTTLDNSVAPPHSSLGSSSGGLFLSRSTSNRAYVPCSSAGWFQPYGAATATTRTSFATAKGFQLGIVRSRVLPALTANEYWFSFELLVPHLSTGSVPSSYTPSASWGCVFKWGDVEIKAKESTYISGNNSTIVHDIVFSVINNGVEVATVSVPQVVAGTVASTNTWLFCLLRVKLDATTGIIDFRVNGVNQSVAYTNQNTVVTTSEAAATVIYIGPMILDNGTNAFFGGIDSIVIDDAAWIEGRIVNTLITVTGDSVLTDAVASGTSVTTLANAITASFTDAKHARFNSASAKAVLTCTAPTTTGYATNLLCYSGVAFGIANRYPQAARKLACGVTLAGVESYDSYIANRILPFSSVILPPESLGIKEHWYVFEKPSGGGKYTITDSATVLPVLKVV